MTKTCSSCKLALPLSEFHKNKGLKDGLHSKCKPCKLKYDKERRQLAHVKAKEKLRAEHRRLYDWKVKINNSRMAAKIKGLEFSIDVEDLPIPKLCPLLNIPIVLDSKNRWERPSIDRIDSTKGYIKGNVWVISLLANTMKSFATKEQLITFSKNVLQIFKN